MLVVSDVVKRFGGLVALEGIDLTIGQGEVVGLIGPNGSGKSTLFNCISGVYTPEAGEIRFQGRRLDGLPAHRVRHLGVGRTFQLVRPFLQLTALENVLVGACFGSRGGRVPERPLDRGRRLLEFVGLGDRADRKAGELILADRKKLEIARALAGEPELLLLDEAAAGLDPGEQRQMIELVGQINGTGVTICVVEHVMSMIMEVSHRVVVLAEGRVIAAGLPSEVVVDPRVIEVYLGEEAGEIRDGLTAT